MLNLGRSDQLFALSDSAVLSALVYVAFTRTKALTAQLCPPCIKSTPFAAPMRVYKASGTASSELRSLLA